MCGGYINAIIQHDMPTRNIYFLEREKILKISVEGFKGFLARKDFELKPISVLSGVNSGGKSSLIQLILLIKQSLENRSAISPLRLNNPYVKLGPFKNILSKQAKDAKFSINFEIPEKELTHRFKRIIIEHYKSVNETVSLRPSHRASNTITAHLYLTFKADAKKRVTVDSFELKVDVFEGENKTVLNVLKLLKYRANNYHILSDMPGITFNGYEGKLDNQNENNHIEIKGEVFFISFFPDWFETNDEFFDSGLIISQLRLGLTKSFNQISYIGPLREEPREFYYQEDDRVEVIGNKGENAAYLLAEKAKQIIDCPLLPLFENGELIVREERITFEAAVNYWLCDVFGLASSLKVEKSKSNDRIHSITLRNSNGAKIPITHVGFGVSQIFPVIVEGLRARKDSMIILEQPEIHLHPKVQSLLFDFVVALNQKGVRFLIETHSDHFINRLRRRVVETESNSLKDQIGLMFISTNSDGSSIQNLDLTEYGTINSWPKGFFDQHDEDIRAIVKAQSFKKNN